MTKAIGLNIVKASAFRRWPVIKAFCLCGNHPFDGWLSFVGWFDAYEEAAAKEALTADITVLEENLETIKADLKAKKAELKKLDTELSKLEVQKTKADAKAAEEAQRAEMEDTIQKLMATGVTAAEILEKLKYRRNGKRYFGGRKIVLDM